jgi:hypothetical protein
VKKLHTPVIDTRVRENAPPGTPKTGEYALWVGRGKVRLVARSGDDSYGIQQDESRDGNVLAGTRFWIRHDDEHRGSRSR